MNEMEAVFQLECNGRHTSDSHAKFKGKFLAPRQKEAVIRAVQNDPNCTGNTVIRNMRNVADGRLLASHVFSLLVSVLVWLWMRVQRKNSFARCHWYRFRGRSD